MTVTWRYDATARVWWLVVDGRPIFNIASGRMPTRDETAAILARLGRFYGWLNVERRAAA